ncbi:MAG: LLM class flavin-dependent oxidoreductase [Acidimicrobiia bacterium]
MELGLFVEPQVGGSYRQLVELAQWAEGQGIAAFARSDHYLNMDDSAHATDALVSYGGLAVETSSIELVTLVSPLTFRHPAVMVKSATTLDEISGGRFSLGVGTGWMEPEHVKFGLDLPSVSERFERLEEALAYITTAFSGGGTTSGTYYSLDLDTVAPKASQNLRIVVGGGGPKKTPTLAGTFANEYNMFLTNRETLGARLAVFRSAAEAAGRNPDEILVSFAGPAMFFATEAEHDAAMTERAAKRGITPDEYTAMLSDRSIPHGTLDDGAAAMAEYASWGVGRYYVQEYAALEDVDTDALGPVFAALGRQ